MSQRLPDNPFYGLNFHPSQLTEQMFSYDTQLSQRASEMEHQYGDQFQDFLDAIKASNYHVFTQLLRSHPEFARRTEMTSKQTAIFYIVPLPNEDLALQMIRDLIAQGADPAYKDPLQQNVMSYIARDGRNKLFDFLTSLGVPTDEVDIYKQTPLFYASREGRVELVKKILDLGANPNHADMNEQTCLFYGAKNGHFEVCKMLIEYGVRHEHVDANKQTALAWAKVSKNQPLIDYLQTLKQSLKPQKEKPLAEPKEPRPLPKRRGPHKEKEEPKNFYKIVFLSHSGGRADVSEDEFEKFKQMYPDVADLLLHPEKIPVVDEKPPQERKKAKWEKVAKKLMSILWKIKGSNIFYEPVDPVKLGCFDYFQIIKQPMDFGTIKTRLISGYYKKIQEFIEDVNLVFKNCILYNGTGSEVGKVGVFIEGEFNRFCKEYNVDQFFTDDNMKAESKTEQSDYGNLGDFAQSFMDEDFGAHDMFNLSETGN